MRRKTYETNFVLYGALLFSIKRALKVIKAVIATRHTTFECHFNFLNADGNMTCVDVFALSFTPESNQLNFSTISIWYHKQIVSDDSAVLKLGQGPFGSTY